MLYFGLQWSQQLRVAPVVELSEKQEAELTKLVRSKRTSVRLSQRAQIVLLAAQGMMNKDIAEQLGVGRVQVARWRERYVEFGLQGIERDLPRGAPPVKVNVQRLVDLTTQSKPPAATHWSTRKMAAELGVSASTVMRHWQANGLKPHVVRGFKVSRDPKFVEKLEDIVGLYMSPPEHALVLCCDEKALAPARDLHTPHTQLLGNVLVHHALRGQQNNLRPLRQPHAGSLGTRKLGQLGFLLIAQCNNRGNSQLLAPMQTEVEHWCDAIHLSSLKSQTLH
jgi:transposase